MQREVWLLLEFLGVALAQLDEVLAGAEGFGAGAGDNCDTEGGLAVEPFEDAVEVPVLGVLEGRVNTVGEREEGG